MKLFILYKTTCLVNGRSYVGLHETDDLYFGTENAIDSHCGNAIEMQKDLRQYGRQAFRVETIHAFPIYEDATRALARAIDLLPDNSYHSKTHQSEQFRKTMSDINLGEKNPFYGKQHSDRTKQELSSFRTGIKWINNGNSEKQIPKNDPVPEGYNPGRLKRIKN